jgi:hypothetical protein
VRLGEILIGAGIITAAQLEQALEAQVMLGARLGTSLVELGHIDLDGLSNALAHQHKLPAALATHFDRADPVVQRAVSPSLAERYCAVPLFRVGKRSGVVASLGPLDGRAVAMLADEIGIEPDRLIVSVAPELRIRYTLERVYNIPRTQRFLRAPGAPRAQPTTHVFEDVGQLELDGPAAVPVEIVRQDTSERRRYVRTLADGETSEPIAIGETDLEEIPDDDLPASVDMIAAGRDREEVTSLAIAVIRNLMPATDGVALFTLRGAIVVSSASFRRDGRKIASVALPLDGGGVIVSALHTRAVARSGPIHIDIDRKLLDALGIDGGYLVAAPLIAGSRAIGTLVVASRERIDVGIVEAITGATAAGFARLMREAVE